MSMHEQGPFKCPGGGNLSMCYRKPWSLEWLALDEVQPIDRERKVYGFQFSSVIQSCPTLQPHGPQHTRSPCPSPTPGVYPNSCPLSQWHHPNISFFVIPFTSCLQPFPASGSFQMSQLFTSGGQSIGVSASASVLPVNTQDWSPLGWTGWISLQSKGGRREGGSGWGTRVYLWWIHVDVWQKQYNIVK